MLPVPPTGCSLSPLQIVWLRGILNHFEPRLFPYSCPDCSPTVALTVPLQGAIWLDIPIIWAGVCQNLGWFLSKSGLVFVKIWAGFCQNLGWFLSKSGLVFVKIWAGFSQNLGWFFSKSGLVFLKIWAGFSQNLGWFFSKSGLDKLSLNSGRFQVQIWEFLSFLIGNLRFKSEVFDYLLSNHPLLFEQLSITF